jgi:glycosyltransferase involved in cell wall biosynthesis
MKPSLSIIIITKNNAETIETCLQSVTFADEIIVLDSGSTDNTRDICKQYTTHVYETDWPGFGPQKNRALAKATGDWVFSIDSDEWIGDELKNEILTTIAENNGHVFSVPRRNRYFGHWIRYGDVGHDRVIRLFKRGAGEFSNDIVHEKVISKHPIQKLHSFLFHDSYRSIDEVLSRMNRYTTLSAQTRNQKGKTTSIAKALFSGWWAFTRSYFFRAGFLDGKAGLIIAISSAESSFYRHVKLIELKRML